MMYNLKLSSTKHIFANGTNRFFSPCNSIDATAIVYSMNSNNRHFVIPIRIAPLFSHLDTFHPPLLHRFTKPRGNYEKFSRTDRWIINTVFLITERKKGAQFSILVVKVVFNWEWEAV